MSYTILSSTLFTLFASFWCCIRPDFPSPHDSKLRILSAKLNIIFWVLIFPEGVFFWSMRQWIEAKKTLRSFQIDGWTQRHGLFLLMGGFMFCDKDGRPLKTLLLRHFNLLVQQKVIDFPTLTSFEIQERSNLHPVFALLAFLQGIWFLARCLSRLSSSSSTSQTWPVVTQLEAMTATLVIANWCIFFCSWKKPLDPGFPILIKPKLTPSTPHYPDHIGSRYISNFEREQSQYQMTEREFQFERPQPESRSILKLTPRLIVSVTIWPFKSIFNDIIQLSPPRYSPTLPDGTLKVPLFYVEDSMQFWPRLLLPTAMLGMCTSVVNFLFILHSDSASFYFPSPVVHLIWRIASITTTSISAFILFLAVLIRFFDYLSSLFYLKESVWERRLDNVAFGCCIIFLLTLFVGLAPLLLARVILLVSSFLCLKTVPGDVFVAQRSWTDYIPHF